MARDIRQNESPQTKGKMAGHALDSRHGRHTRQIR
jgi:hypothetical protein